jgi:hypothetical protein
MGNPVADSRAPALAAFGLVVLGLVIAAAGGISGGSIVGGAVAAAGAMPGLYGMWKGIQQETQGTLAISVIAVLVALVVGGALIALRVLDWVW